MDYRTVIDRGLALVEVVDDDYANVTVGPIGEAEAVAVGYVHTEGVVIAIDLDADEATEATRWFAYDVTGVPEPGAKVGRTVAGYATREEAVVALVEEHSAELAEHGFAVDEDTEPLPWGRDEVAACPYLDDDEFAKVVRVPLDGTVDDLPAAVSDAIDEIMGERHPEAARRGKLACVVLARRIGQFFPVLWDAGLAPVLSIRAGVAVDSYGSTWLEDGDPFQCLGISIFYAAYDDAYDRHDRRNVRLHGSLEMDVYEPAPGDHEQVVYVVTGEGDERLSSDGLSFFIESDSFAAACDEDIEAAADSAFLKLMAVSASLALSCETKAD